MICATPNEVQFITISKTQTAHLALTCSADFFDNYAIFGCILLQAVVPIKNVLAPFRSQKIENITFELPVDECRLIVTVDCENGLVKKYTFPVIDREVSVMGEIESLPVRVIVEPASMIKYLSTFHHRVEEVALIAHPQETGGGGGGGGTNSCGAPTVEFKSYIDPNKSQIDDSLHAMISIYNTLPFASYSNSLDSVVEIIFNIKDFKAMLTLSEMIGTNIELSFNEPSQPLVVVSHFLDGYGGYVKARLVVSTIDNPYSAAYQEEQEPGAVRNGAAGPPLLPGRQQQQPREEIQLEDNYGYHVGDDEEDGGIANTPPEDMEVLPSAFPGLISAPSRF